jgi:F-type H+-transporting ATPase subunit alpha
VNLEHITKKIASKIESYKRKYNSLVTGTILECNDGVIFVDGLSGVGYGELIRVNESYAMVLNIEEDKIGAIVLNDIGNIAAGDTAYATGYVADVGVSEEILGRVINPLGTPMDGKSKYKVDKYQHLEAPSPEIMDRDSVNEPLETGIMAIDAMIPIGKGQRELIIGDMQTGKTAIAIDTILNQKDKNVICIYVAIGQKASSISKILQVLTEANAMSYTTIVASTANNEASMQYLAPYTGCAIAEYFMQRGKDVLVVYDDLTKHAIAYRTLSLLLKRPSGREAFPGDIFYTHSRLLERAGKLSKELGGGSMTALPIIETQMGDISAYIPTNVISITDGQIFLETELFYAGRRPAVNEGLSVSRIGGSAQYKAIRKVASKLRLELANYRELAIFSRFVAELDNETKKILEQGAILTKCLTQEQYKPLSFEKQVVYLYVVTNQLIPFITEDNVREVVAGLFAYLEVNHNEIFEEIKTEKDLSDKIIGQLENAIRDFVGSHEKQ